MVLGLVVLTFLTQGSMAKALLMACIGIVLGLIGLDSITAQPRLTFGRLELIDGIGLVPVVMGLFGVAEMLLNIEQAIKRDVINAKITQPAAEQGGLESQRRPDGARHRPRFLPRHPAGRRRGDRLVRLLRAGEADVEDAGAFRQGRDRGRGGAGGRQQRGGRRRLHSADDARHSAQRGDGAAARRLHHPRPAARPADDDAEPRPVLGHRRQHVYRQRHAAGAQHAADRHVGAGAEAALQHPVPADHAVLHHRRLSAPATPCSTSS